MEQQEAAIPYRVLGATYYPLKSAGRFSQEGIASWYGPKFHGQLTSNKETYDMNAMTAAHKTLPFNTRVKVVNLENGLEAVVRINDRGPFVGDRIIDLSRKAAEQLGVIEKGTARVRLTALAEPRDGSHSAAAQAIESFSVQVGVFKDRGNAGRLERQVPNSRTESQVKGGETYFRVLVGRYADFEEASRQMDALRSLGYAGAFIVAANKKP
ncbi:MAG: septal ring lytic transglycosylase RlpA family protein [Nitrospinales bacterium]